MLQQQRAEWVAWVSLYPHARQRERSSALVEMFPGVVFAGGLTEVLVSWKASKEAQQHASGLDELGIILE